MANVSKDDLRPEILLKTDQTALAVNVACNGLAVAEGTSPARTVKRAKCLTSSPVGYRNAHFC